MIQGIPNFSPEDLKIYAEITRVEKDADDKVDKSDLCIEAKHKLSEFRNAYKNGNYDTVVSIYPDLMAAWNTLLHQYTFAGNRQDELLDAARMAKIAYVKAKAALTN